MSMCLQGMVEELIMKKQGKKIKKVSTSVFINFCQDTGTNRSALKYFNP